MSHLSLTSLQISRHDGEAEERNNDPTADTWLDIRIHVTGQPASISELHGAMMEAQFGGGTIDSLASALGNSSFGQCADVADEMEARKWQ